jgi:hypothetical protein
VGTVYANAPVDRNGISLRAARRNQLSRGLHKEMEAAIQDTDVRHRFTELGAEPTASAPEELAKFVASELVKRREVIVRANIPVGELLPQHAACCRSNSPRIARRRLLLEGKR